MFIGRFQTARAPTTQALRLQHSSAAAFVRAEPAFEGGRLGYPAPLTRLRIVDAHKWLQAAAAIAGLCAAACLGACRSPGADSQTTASTPAHVEALPLQAAALLAPRESVFTAGAPARPRFMLLEVGPRQPDGTLILTRSTGPSASGPWTPSIQQQIVFTSDGHAAIVEEINRDERVELVYQPPLVILPANLGPSDRPFDQTVHLRVHPLGDRLRIKAEGQARQSIVHVGADADGQRLRVTFTASLPPAEVTNITQQWFNPATGLVTEHREERTRVLGVPTRRNREDWTLISR